MTVPHPALLIQHDVRAVNGSCLERDLYPYQPKAALVVRPLRHTAEAVSEARFWAQKLLTQWKVEDADAMLLVISELVTNAIEHALPPLELHMRHDPAQQRVWVGVCDGGPALESGSWIASCADDEHGRGLRIVAALADSRGRVSTAQGRATCWVQFRTESA
ncbi:ATP-binding protein [Streptomyces cyaneofuscatus]|uniref:ATP-binding protein n=1 Tax=Streptomyces cyaneofuscatus TaxID=66883 RepID=UPI00382F9B9D